MLALAKLTPIHHGEVVELKSGQIRYFLGKCTSQRFCMMLEQNNWRHVRRQSPYNKKSTIEYFWAWQNFWAISAELSCKRAQKCPIKKIHFLLRSRSQIMSGQKFSVCHDYKTNSWILEKPGNSWKILENTWTSETGFIPDILFIPDFILNSRILPSQAPTNPPTILLDILCYASLNEFNFSFFLGFC